MKEFVILETESPTFGGRSFGAVGQYERLTGYAVGAVDPGDAKNAGIVNIDKAPRDADGNVEYRTDIFILRPIDPVKANGWLFYEILNRGSKRAVCRVNSGPATNDTSLESDAGTGFLMDQGYTIVWSGWQDDIEPGDGRMGAKYPVASDNGAPITGTALEEVIDESNTRLITKTLAYPAATLDRDAASLTARVRERDPRQQPTGLDWRYLDERNIEITRPDDAAFDELLEKRTDEFFKMGNPHTHFDLDMKFGPFGMFFQNPLTFKILKVPFDGFKMNDIISKVKAFALNP